jgi:uncharacterized protein YggT (Ycf19 family)
MGLIDFILNLAGLLLWLNWCSVRLDPLAQPSAKTLLGTLRRAGPGGWGRWKFLVSLTALLLIRALFYWQIGSALNWTPNLDLAAIVLPFRSEFQGRMFLFSLFSFGLTLAVFYVWLLFLATVNRRIANADPFQKLVQAHLGRAGHWPWPMQLSLPFVAAGMIWLALHPLLVHWQIDTAAHSTVQLLKQALLLGVSLYLSLRYLIAGFLFAHLLTSYVYLGSHPVWSFVNGTARHLLTPLRWAPLRLGKVDFTPLVGIVLVFLAAEFALHWLPRLYPL